ncbi:CUB and sushi domain-containing protein 1-like [Gigantopelta aegis]|uniref:CUB and sushi domain-containing protein 1-like n=1 Tax=Gigantopelta aegis TaxID=1735272 RepID=UPI001B888EB5|nr:CUB and sushi domain-containing protein 1-like [Gigantopelta aegis]
MSEVEYRCNVGYKIDSDDSWRICNESAKWSGEQPICIVVTCPRGDLFVPYASFVGSSVTYNSIITYSCVKGYNLTAGNLQRTCQNNGKWSGTAPTCSIIHCPSPVMVSNTILNYGSTEYQSTATYRCILGYKRATGDQSRYCLETAVWSGSDLICEIVNCGRAPLKAGAKMNSSGLEYLDKTYYECFYQEDLDNLVNWTLVCGPEGNWLGESLTCAAVRKTFLPELKEADGSYGVGIISLSIVGIILLVIILLDIPTIMRHSVYMKRNLRRFHKNVSSCMCALRKTFQKFQSNMLLRNKSGILSVKSVKWAREDNISFKELLSADSTLSLKSTSPVGEDYCCNTPASSDHLSVINRLNQMGYISSMQKVTQIYLYRNKVAITRENAATQSLETQ